jgi:glycosyltransferase involved in cell wall biosynthesis
VGLACLKPDQFPKLRQARQAPLYELPMRHRLDWRPAWRLTRLVEQEDYGLLHAHTPRSALIAGLVSQLTGRPLICHVHSPTIRDTTDRWRGRINALAERYGLARASAVIAVSESLARHVRKRGVAADRVCVVANGVPCREPREPRSSLATDWTLGTVALFRPRKGIEVLLKALAELRSQALPVRLRAVGGFETPGYERGIKRLTEELGLGDAVDWTGFRQDVNRELAQMDLFVLPSLFGEGMPMVVLEALAAGVPVVASRVEGVPEVIRDGRDGLLVEPNDAEELAAALKRVVSGQVNWHALRADGRKRQVECFSAQSMAAGIAAVYRRVLDRVP